MKKYIFLSYYKEFFEGLDNSSTNGLTIIKWENPKNAFKNLLIYFLTIP